MNWTAIIGALIGTLLPTFESWFTTWLASILPNVAATLPAPSTPAPLTASPATPAVNPNDHLLLLHAAKATLYPWNVLKNIYLTRAIAQVTAGAKA